MLTLSLSCALCAGCRQGPGAALRLSYIAPCSSLPWRFSLCVLGCGQGLAVKHETEPRRIKLCPSPSQLTSLCRGLQAGPSVEPERSYIAKCAELACRPSSLVLSQLRLSVLNLSHMPLDDSGVCPP